MRSAIKKCVANFNTKCLQSILVLFFNCEAQVVCVTRITKQFCAQNVWLLPTLQFAVNRNISVLYFCEQLSRCIYLFLQCKTHGLFLNFYSSFWQCATNYWTIVQTYLRKLWEYIHSINNKMTNTSAFSALSSALSSSLSFIVSLRTT